MNEPIIIVKVPKNYTHEDKEELEKKVCRAVEASKDANGVIVVPDDVEVYILPVPRRTT